MGAITLLIFAVAKLQPGDRYYTASRRSVIVIEAAGGLIIIITRLEPSDCDKKFLSSQGLTS